MFLVLFSLFLTRQESSSQSSSYPVIMHMSELLSSISFFFSMQIILSITIPNLVWQIQFSVFNFISVTKTQKFDKKKDPASEADSPSTHQLMRSVRHANRRHQARDASPTEPPQPPRPTKHGSSGHRFNVHLGNKQSFYSSLLAIIKKEKLKLKNNHMISLWHW